MKRRILISIIFLGFVGPIACFGQNYHRTQLNFQKDLFPEGIALDIQSNRLFLNSLKYNKIVVCSIDGSSPENFIETGKYDYLPGFGMTVRGDTLYALGNELVDADNISVLLLLNVNTGNLIDKYSYQTSELTYFNDLAISTSNEVFITDSESNKLYRIQRPNKEIEVFMESKEIAHSNGITISPDDKLLYLGSQNGVRIVNRMTKEVINTSNKQNLGIDGLKFYENSLIGIVNVWDSKPENNGVFRYYLNNKGTKIAKKERIVTFSNEYRIPTTFDIYGNEIFFIMNTQLENFDEMLCF